MNKRLREILVVRNTLSHVPPVPFVRLRVARKIKNVISKMLEGLQKKTRFVFNIDACKYIYILTNLSEKKL